MCKFIEAEVLAANALIDIMEEKDIKKARREENVSITVKELNDYGIEVIRFINEYYNEGAVILYNGDGRATNRFINCSDLLEYNGETISVKENVEYDDLYKRFRVPLAYEILAAVYNQKVKAQLFNHK